MKILQVFDFFSLPHGGGTVDVIAKLSKALAERGHEVTICTGDFEEDRPYLELLSGVEKAVLHSEINKFGIYYMPNIKYVDVSMYDVIHFHCYRSYQNSVLYKKAVKAGVPYVIDAHGSTVDRGVKNILRKIYDYKWGYDLLKHASRVIAETEIGVAEWRKLGVPDSKITLLHPFIDTKEFENLPERGVFERIHNNNLGEHLILFLGRIHKDKGLEFLVKSFAELLKVREDVRLVIAGEDDGYEDELWKIFHREGVINKILLASFLRGESKLSALVSADMLIQPSINEAGARPSLESLMCGTPVIVTKNTGAGRAIEDIDGGLTVEYGNIPQMVHAMQNILDNPQYAQIRVKKAQQYIRDNLSVESQITKYEKLYREATA
jgi:glycosyltransferase involved in cell wall biosynthesis